MSNLPIIQPLIRKGFKKIGLSQLFSSSGKTSQSYPLSSRVLQSLTNRGEHSTKNNKTDAAGPSHTQVSAWGSDEHILSDPSDSKDITVVSETIVQSEPWFGEDGHGSSHASTPPKERESPLPHR